MVDDVYAAKISIFLIGYINELVINTYLTKNLLSLAQYCIKISETAENLRAVLLTWQHAIRQKDELN